MIEKNTHFMSTLKVGPKGQIVIPKEIRDMFQIKPGDNLIIMAASRKGIALHRQNVLEKMAQAIFEGQGKEIYPEEDESDVQQFAETIRETVKNDISDSTV